MRQKDIFRGEALRARLANEAADRGKAIQPAPQRTLCRSRALALAFPALALPALAFFSCLHGEAPASAYAAGPLASLVQAESAPQAGGKQSPASDQQADNLAQTAANAQNAKDFEMALETWARLCKEHPGSKHFPKAQLNAGICAAQLKRYDVALPYFEQALKLLPAEEVEGLATGHLFLGYSQLELGRKLLAEGKIEPAQQLLTTSTQLLAQQLEKYPKYRDSDQAAYFQGLAFEQLQRLPEAAAAYARMLEFPQQTFRLPGLFALANVNEQLGKYDLALKYYQEYQSAAAKEPSPPADLTEVRLRAAETLWQLALGAQNKGEQAEYQRLTTEALRELDPVLKDQSFPFRDEALFRFGLIQSQLGDHSAAAKAFFEVTSLPNSPRSAQATLFTGRELLAAKSNAEAEKWFDAAVKAQGKYSAEAAHWLVQARFLGGQPLEAYQAAESLLPLTVGTAWEPELLAGRAESAWQQQSDVDLRKRVPDLYLAVVAKSAGTRLAESALYNAAFAKLELRELDGAIALCERFEKELGQSEFLPDVLEVHADALLGKEQIAAAIPLFDRLIQDFAANSKQPAWRVRRGLTSYLAGDFDAASQILEPLAPSLADPQLAAEAWHWLGASRLQQKQLDAAIAAFEKSRASSGAWRRAPETLSLLAQAQATQGDPRAAEQTLAELKQKFPEHQSAADAELRLAKQAFAAGEFARALEIYDRLLQLVSPSITPHALYDSGWCLAKLASGGETESRLSEARGRFVKVGTDYPQHELAPLALLGLAAVERQAARPAEALAALDQFLKANPDHARAIDARYERGLVLGDLKRWPEAVTAWQELIPLPGAKDVADRVAYELAWALRESGNPEGANQQFEKIAREFPQSPIRADAFFQLGERDYSAGKFAEAAAWFEKCLAATPSAALGERACYKLGFTQFRSKDFAQSLVTFQRQVKDYPQGELHADGMFMVGESLFEAKQYDSALAAYRAAKPLLETSNRVKPANRWLTLLHAAQAANNQKQYEAAVELAKELADDAEADEGLRLDAALELGNAFQQLGKPEPAVEAWTRASASVDKTGARATCMLGETLFSQKKFDEATRQFKQVIYGYGGEAADAEIDPWQAFAAYELARCSFVQVSAATSPELKQKLISESIKWFEYMLEKYPGDRLAGDATKELEKLKQLQSSGAK